MRAFLAVLLEPELRQQIAGIQQGLKDIIAGSAASRARITWARPDTIHLTIKFLGEIDERIAERLREQVRAAIDGRQTINIPLARIGAFPRALAPRALWVGPSPGWEQHDDAKRVDAMVHAIDDACAELGIGRDEHPWRPHLTLGRVRDREREVGRALTDSGLFDQPISAGALQISEIVLMKSVMQPDGPVHTKLWSVVAGAG